MPKNPSKNPTRILQTSRTIRKDRFGKKNPTRIPEKRSVWLAKRKASIELTTRLNCRLNDTRKQKTIGDPAAAAEIPRKRPTIPQKSWIIFERIFQKKTAKKDCFWSLSGSLRSFSGSVEIPGRPQGIGKNPIGHWSKPILQGSYDQMNEFTVQWNDSVTNKWIIVIKRRLIT